MNDAFGSGKPARQGMPWNEEEERQLFTAFSRGMSISEIAETHMRSEAAILSHLKKLGALDEYGVTVHPLPVYEPSPSALKQATKSSKRPKLQKERRSEVSLLETEINSRFSEALALMAHSDSSVFITGKAGTGKSTLLRHFRQTSQKNIVVLAPTGIAALNVGGQTIHNFFRFQVDVTPQKIEARKKPKNAKLYKRIETVVIDEISMVRADVLDCIEVFLRLHGPHPGMPFGGVQVVFIGDLYQLPPVVGANERSIFSEHYATPYFFSAHALKDFAFSVIELEKVYRQKDHYFIELLNRVRNDTVTSNDIVHLNSRYKPSSSMADTDFSISLTTTNKKADDINHEHLASLAGRTYHASAHVKGEFGHEYFPASPDLAFKRGAQVMLLTNDREGRWVNGSIGVIKDVKEDLDDREYVTIELQDSDEPIAVYPYKWEVFQFALADNQIESEPVGTFEQYPFRLAWAVTIHKSQGKTFEKVTIDIGAGAFAGGQVYVALSRCTSLDGITLKTPLKRYHIHIDRRIDAFMSAHTMPKAVTIDQTALIEESIAQQGRIEIVYLKGDGQQTVRTVYPKSLGQETFKNTQFMGMKAFCTQSKEELLFSVERILMMKKAP